MTSRKRTCKHFESKVLLRTNLGKHCMCRFFAQKIILVQNYGKLNYVNVCILRTQSQRRKRNNRKNLGAPNFFLTSLSPNFWNCLTNNRFKRGGKNLKFFCVKQRLILLSSWDLQGHLLLHLLSATVWQPRRRDVGLGALHPPSSFYSRSNGKTDKSPPPLFPPPPPWREIIWGGGRRAGGKFQSG